MQMDIFDFAMGAAEEAVRPPVERKEWMYSKKMLLVTEETLSKVIDECIEAGIYACDLETTGLDNRVFNGETVDKIVGVCLAPNTNTGYYIPLRHIDPDGEGEFFGGNVPLHKFRREFKRLVDSPAVAVFHNGKFDHEFLQFDGSGLLGEWDSINDWEDTLILAYLRNPRERSKGLKALSGTELGWEMIELDELFPKDAKGNSPQRMDFSTLDPTWDPVVWYACSDAICTLALFHKLHPQVVKPSDGHSQQTIYKVEKSCVPATRWMERNRIPIAPNVVAELIRVANKDYFSALLDVYKSASEILGRDITPSYVRLMRGDFGDTQETREYLFDQDSVDRPITLQVKDARKFTSDKRRNLFPDPPNHKGSNYPSVYDVNSAPQLGLLLEEMGVPHLERTEKSKQVDTSKAAMKRLTDRVGHRVPFLKKIQTLREVGKALSTYLIPMHEDLGEDKTIRISFNGHKVDTGRFATPTPRNPMKGWPKLNLQSIPAGYVKDRPECMLRLRECIRARDGWFIAAIDFSGVELRLVTNLSMEPMWINEFFRCSECSKTFDRGDGRSTPPAPPPFCPRCGSDKIGDLHSLTCESVYGTEHKEDKDKWKELRQKSKCVHPDTMIRTSKGVHRIGLLPSQEGEFLPQTGMTVWANDGWKPLLETYGGGSKKLYHIITRRGVLTCSPEHRIQLADGSLASIESGLSVGARLPEPPVEHDYRDASWAAITHRAFHGVPSMEIPTNAALAYVAGLIMGDGSKSPSSCSIVHGHVNKTDSMGVSYADWQRVMMDACKEAGLDPVPRSKTIYLGSRHTIRYLAALQVYTLPEDTDNGTRSFRIPDWVWQAGPQALYPFLGGLFDTDGTVSVKDKNLSVTTKDPIFAGQIASALQVLGMHVSFETCWNKTYERWYFRIKVFRENSVKFIPYMRHPGKTARLRAGGDRKPQCGRRKPNEVLLIQEAGVQPCIDLHVGSDDHLYWANGFVSHNSTNFALCYGGGGNAVVRATQCSDNEGWRIKRQFDGTYKGLKRWWDGQHAFARKNGFVLTAFGRKYPLPDINHKEGGFRSKAERNAVNGPIQGSSADITKIAMALIYKECKKRGWLDDVRMIITMHDELVFEIRAEIMEEAIPVLRDLMTSNPIVLARRWQVPLTTDCEIGQDYTVPWNITEFQHGKEAWPDALKPFFKSAQEAPPTGKVGGDAPTVFSFRLQAPLSEETLERLVEVLQVTQGTGKQSLEIITEEGSPLEGLPSLCVDPEQFVLAAKTRGLC